MLNSLKQLMRTPVKAALFFLLMAAGSMLLVFGSVMLVQSMQRILAAEKQFTTIGMVEQVPSSVRNDAAALNKCRQKPYIFTVNQYNQVLEKDILSFEGAGYIKEPETRAYYHAYLPNYNHSNGDESGFSSFIIEFTPIADCVASQPSDVRVQRIILNRESTKDEYQRKAMDVKTKLEIGDIIKICDHSTENPIPLKAGKSYICNLVWDPVMETNQQYAVYQPPYSTQYGIEDSSFLSPLKVRNGEEVVKIEDRRYLYTLSDPSGSRIEALTEGFYDEGGRGQDWLSWSDVHTKYSNWFLVLPTNGLQLIPVFHHKQAYVYKGREITTAEFETGANVCMVSSDFALRNHIEPGDKLTLPLAYALNGYLPDRENVYPGDDLRYPTYHRGYSPLDSNMKPYEPFWTAEYEIVGTYQPINASGLICGTTELARDMFIIPAKSIGDSDENNIAHYGPMSSLTTSFQIPNGTIEEFDAKLKAAVPEADQLNISYNDNGYTQVISTLNTARLTALLLFAVGLFATLAIVILLLFFFIVKQKKRTAVERSLGMTKKQCRKSLIAGVLILTLGAAVAGSGCGAILLNNMQPSADVAESTEFDTSYSLWATNKPADVQLNTEDGIFTAALYIAIPLLLTLFVLLLSLFLVEQSLKIEPILLLSTKAE